MMFTDLMQLDEVYRLDTTCSKITSGTVKSTTCIKSVAFLAVQITLDCSTGSVLQSANSASYERATVSSDFAIYKIALVWLFMPYFKVICKFAWK